MVSTSCGVIGRSPTVWYSTVTIDKGSGAGVKINDPVVDGDGLVGRVTDITLSYTYVDPGDGSSVVIPNQLLVEGVVHNHSTEDTVA